MQSFLEAVAEREVDAQRPFTAERVIQPEILEAPPCAMQSVLADADLVRLIGERLPSHIRLVLGSNLHTRATCRCARCNCRRACKLWRREIHAYTQRKQEAVERLRLGHHKLRHFGRVAKNDADVVRSAIEKHGPDQLQHASSERRDDVDLVRWVVAQFPLALRFASQRLRDCSDVVRLAVSINPVAVWYASERLRRNDEVLVWAALRRTRDSRQLDGDPRAMSNFWLWYGSHDLTAQDGKNDVAPTATPQRRRRMASGSGTIRSPAGVYTTCNESIVRGALDSRWCGAAEHFWKDASFVRAACAAFAPVLFDGRIDLAFRDDEACVRAAASAAHGVDEVDVLSVASERLRGDRAFVISLLEMEWQSAAGCLRYAAETLRDDGELVLVAVRRQGLALEHASLRLRADRGVASCACRSNGLALQFCAPAFQDEAAFVTSAEALRYASPRLQDDDDLVQRLVRQAGRDAALVHASSRLRKAYHERYEAAAGAEYARLRMQM